VEVEVDRQLLSTESFTLGSVGTLSSVCGGLTRRSLSSRPIRSGLVWSSLRPRSPQQGNERAGTSGQGKARQGKALTCKECVIQMVLKRGDATSSAELKIQIQHMDKENGQQQQQPGPGELDARVDDTFDPSPSQLQRRLS